MFTTDCVPETESVSQRLEAIGLWRMEPDYSEAGRNMLADLVSKWGGAWWGENVNKMDCLYTDPDTGR